MQPQSNLSIKTQNYSFSSNLRCEYYVIVQNPRFDDILVNSAIHECVLSTRIAAKYNLRIQSIVVVNPLVLNETQHEQDNGNTKLGEIGSYHTTNSEQELRNPNISQSKGQSSIITTPSELGQVKGKVIALRQRIQPTNDHNTRSKTGQPKSVPDKSFRSPEARANSGTLNHFILQYEQRIKADVAQLLQTSPQNTPKATRPVQDPRNRSKDSILKTRYKWSPITRLTSRISWTEQERKEEGRESKDLRNHEPDKENRKISDRNGGQTARYLEQ
ncbi:MAG: hypothetical protein EZS28_008985 [Streblomastix strix]|uniref:Uncharacterized protein n=1 Tax=Streblomastix strix TaxID=222440 RepID=A0A5J4WLI3_9EUKA|nr:MAG: hypothetical protein EZS28_008985 [Streblomastix strix]